MANILIAYITKEGQTAKIAETIATQLQSLNHDTRLIDLAHDDPNDAPCDYQATIIAASVHMGRHQEQALAFVKQFRDMLDQRKTAFLSVSMSAASTEQAGKQQAKEQLESFLQEANWRPHMTEMIAGAIRISEFSCLWRWIIKVSQRMVNKELTRLGWPDLGRDQEFTDWDALHRFVEQFADGLKPS